MAGIDTKLKAFGLKIQDVERMDLYYPKILESIVPLSLTGVTPRNFFSWKENGLVELSLKKDEEEGRKNVKLNLIEFIWVKTIQVMRDFGLSYSAIKEVRAILFSKYYKVYQNQLEVMEKMYRKNLDADHDEIEEILGDIKEYLNREAMIDSTADESLLEQSLLYEVVCSSFLLNSRVTFLISKLEHGFHIDLSMHDPVAYMPETTSTIYLKPHFAIPLFSLIEDFFNEPRSEKMAEAFGFINPKEKKVLDAIRKRDFLELHIKLSGQDDIIIDAVKDGNITDEQASKIRKILGLSNYEEVTLKYRNEKNLYFKNKKRL